MRKLLLILSTLLLSAALAGNAFTITADSTPSSAINADAFELPYIGTSGFEGEQGNDDLGVAYDDGWDLNNPYNPEYYVYIDNEGLSGYIEPAYNWRDASGGTELDFSGVDDQVVQVSLPSTLSFYNFTGFDSGDDYDSCYVSTNGLVGFEEQFYTDGSYTDYANRPLPVSINPPHSMVAVFWDDMVLLDNSHIYTDSQGDEFIISWEDMGIRGYEDLADGTVSVQLVINFTNQDFLIQLRDISVPGTGHDKAGSASIGVEDRHGNIGLSWIYNDETKIDDEAACIIFPWVAPADFDMPDPGDPGADILEQGVDNLDLTWDGSSNENPWGPTDIGYYISIYNDTQDEGQTNHGKIDGDETEVFSDTTSSTSYTIDSSLFEVNAGNSHYQILIFADDGWGRTQSTNVDLVDQDHYTFKVIEPTQAPSNNIVETTWGQIKTNQ